MATRTVSNAGGNWSVTTTWTGGVVPIAGDNIDFTATSGNLTVNVASAVLVGVNFTNYLGTITFNNVINTSGALNLGTGGYTQAGASGITLNTTATLTSGGVTWSRTLIFLGASPTYTFVGNWTSTGLITFSTSGTTTLTNNTLNINGGLTQTTAGIYAGTTAIVFGGTGTWSNSAGGGAIRNNTTVNTPGTLTISGTVYYDTGTFTYTAGTVTTTGSTFRMEASTTLNTNGITWFNLQTGITAVVVTLSSNLTITGTFTCGGTSTSFILGGNNLITSTANFAITSACTFTVPQNLTFVNATLGTSTSSPVLNTNQISVTGNLTTNGSAPITGTTLLKLTGTGIWSSLSTAVLRMNTTIDTLGTITLSGNILYDTGTLTYIAGGTVTTTLSTLTIGANTTLNTNGITWNNINTTTGVVITLGSNLTLTGTLSLGNGFTSFTLGGFNLISTNANLTMLGTNATFTLSANQTFKTLTITGTNATLTSNTLTITENLTINNQVQGSTNIIYGGTGTWTASGSTALINNILTINTAGTLTISGTVFKGNTLFTYTTGTIIDTTGTVAVQQLTLNLSGFTFRKLLVNNTITLTSNINATTFGTWGANATTFTLGAFSLNFTHLELGNTGITTLPTNWTAQNVELVPISTAIINANSITIRGNFTQTGAGGYSGTTTFIYGVPALATGTWSRTGAGTLVNNFTVNSAGTINFTGGIIGSGIFTYTAGTVNCQVNSTLYNAVAGTIFNGAGITWYNVVFGLPSGIASVGTAILNTQLICIGTLTLQRSDTVFSGTNGTFDTYNLILGTDASGLKTTQLVSTKTYRVRQSFTSTQTTDAVRVLLRSTIGGSQAIFTLDSGATIDVGFVNATDINSSLGRPVYSYRGVFSNTLNWGLLPIDNTRSGRSTFVG